MSQKSVLCGYFKWHVISSDYVVLNVILKRGDQDKKKKKYYRKFYQGSLLQFF